MSRLRRLIAALLSSRPAAPRQSAPIAASAPAGRDPFTRFVQADAWFWNGT